MLLKYSEVSKLPLKYIGCSKIKEVAIYPLMGLLHCSLFCLNNKLQISHVKEPEQYASKIKLIEDYYGYIAWATIYLKTNRGKQTLGENVLKELI